MDCNVGILYVVLCFASVFSTSIRNDTSEHYPEVSHIRALTGFGAYPLSGPVEDPEGEMMTSSDPQYPAWVYDVVKSSRVKGEDSGTESDVDGYEQLKEYDSVDDYAEEKWRELGAKGPPEAKSGYDEYGEDSYANVEIELPGEGDDGEDYQTFIQGSDDDDEEGDVYHEVRVVPKKRQRGNRGQQRGALTRRAKIRRMLAARRRNAQRLRRGRGQAGSDKAVRRKLLLDRLRQVRQMKRQLQQQRLQNPQSPVSGLGYDRLTVTYPPPTAPPLTGSIVNYGYPQYQAPQFVPAPAYPQPPTYLQGYSYNPPVVKTIPDEQYPPQAQPNPYQTEPNPYSPLTDPLILKAALEQAQLIANAVNTQEEPPYFNQKPYATEYQLPPRPLSSTYETPYRHTLPPPQSPQLRREPLLTKRKPRPQSLSRRFRQNAHRAPESRSSKLNVEFRTENQDRRIRQQEELDRQRQSPKPTHPEEEEDDDVYDYGSYGSALPSPQETAADSDDEEDYSFDYDLYDSLDDEPPQATGEDIERPSQGTGGPTSPPKSQSKTKPEAPAVNPMTSQSENAAPDWTTIYGDQALQKHLKDSEV
ncbi:hypothetical protein CAPTEDRAFT_189220 [Capitella teleta]|uniref:Uncharacterized protein n=1 Tax=Capitella teleta TaxID=283909 RepID=R7TAJ8_CAPTE|nr:hypothetical protein CAPTEDRAFT_189220 [Capitella teleta]|eukprot:ELT90522.1 hypothetical protein CAPTEDRAFT_189220 [Capitella teleta]